MSLWNQNFLDEIDVDSYICHTILDILTIEIRLVRLSEGSSKNSFNFKAFKFDSSKLQQRFFLVERITSTKQDLSSTLYCLNKLYDQEQKAKNSKYYSIPTLKNPSSYTFSKDHIFCHHVHEIKDHPRRHTRLSFRPELKDIWLFWMMKFTQAADQFLLAENIILHCSELLKIFTICCSIFSIRRITGTNYIIWHYLKQSAGSGSWTTFLFELLKRHLFQLDFHWFTLTFIKISCSRNHFVIIMFQNHQLISFSIFLHLFFPFPKQKSFSMSSVEVNLSLNFGSESVLLDFRNISNETVMNSIELPLSLWNLLESRRVRFVEGALTWAPFTQEQ